MKRLIMKTLTIFLLLVSIFIFTSSLTYSWFSPYIVQSHIIGKTREKYFQRGDGSSGDPFIISKASHFFNLSYLQNLGMFHDKVYHFKVADNQNNRTVIDFSSSKVLPIHRTIQPIGTEQYPFKGVFEGNNSVLKLYTVDGTGKQDIGTFGYVASGSKITNLFLDSPNIISNPLADIDTISFHNHNNLLNISTGFIVGHLCNEASVEYVYVVEPKITSLSNSFLNMTQHGLIGYNEADDGKIPLNASYSFSLNAVNAGDKIKQAITDDMFGNYIVDGTTTPLKNAISQNSQDVDINSPYSFSTIKIKENSTAPSKYLYDEMVSKDLVIGLDDKYFNRENIDLIGPISFKKAGIKDSTMDIHSSSTSFNIPMVGDESNPTKFTPTNYPNSIILYVRPTNDPTNLGKITANYDKGGGDLRYNSGWLNGIYQGGSVSQPVTFSQTGLEVTMSSFNAFTAVRVNKTTGEMTVVDSNPDF